MMISLVGFLTVEVSRFTSKKNLQKLFCQGTSFAYLSRLFQKFFPSFLTLFVPAFDLLEKSIEPGTLWWPKSRVSYDSSTSTHSIVSVLVRSTRVAITTKNFFGEKSFLAEEWLDKKSMEIESGLLEIPTKNLIYQCILFAGTTAATTNICQRYLPIRHHRTRW